uniref:Uncharacterized protein n=2 Tax=Alexandrium monilatum TaxID=311494 RepID=A0A7S4RW99_9DINO
MLERKIRHAELCQEKLEKGEQVKFLYTDSRRLERLEKRLTKCNFQLEEVKRALAIYDLNSDDASRFWMSEQTGGSASISIRKSSVHAGNKDISHRRALSTRRRRRRITMMKRKEATSFSAEVQDTVHDIGDEYSLQSGDIFREVFGGNMEGVKAWLKEEESDINEYHPSIGWTPLHMAVSMGDPEMVTLVLKSSGDTGQATEEQGWFPIHFAVWKNSVQLLRMLVKKDDDCVRYKTKEGETALHISIQSSSARIREDMVRELLKAHGDPNTRKNDEWSPLAMAVVRNYQAEVRHLVQNRGNVFDMCPDEPGKTIWQASARHPGLQELVRSKLNSRDLHIVQNRWGAGR